MTDWERCVAFHGHECGGLTIGYQAARYAKELLELTFSDDEEVVCITENDACGVDAIQDAPWAKGTYCSISGESKRFPFITEKTENPCVWC